MLQKFALFGASLVAALTLAVALAAAGFAPGSAPAAATASSTSAAGWTADGVPPVQVDRVYVAAPPPQRTVTVHKVVKSSGGEAEVEGSEGDD